MSGSSPDPRVLRALDEAVIARRDEIVAVARALVAFETVSVDYSPGSQQRPTQEADLQAWVARRLAAIGCQVDQWEPDADELRDHRMVPDWHHWRGRPVTVGTLPGAGGGRSLIVNGHIDVVGVGDPARWSSPPFAAEVHGDRIVGRGTVDMKGGIAAALVALETLVGTGIRLGGDVVFQVVPDEETGGMGTIAAAERGYRADAAVIPEPTGLDVWAVTRGILHARLTVLGRSAHAEVTQPDWRDGGGVNANHKALPIAAALVELGDSWSARTHPLVGAPELHVTALRGGEFISNIPERCEISVNVTYLPASADGDGFGSAAMAELRRTVAAACAGDAWLEAHPPEWTWLMDYPPSELDGGEPILSAARAAAASVGHDAHVAGLDSGYDGALLSTLYGIPTTAFGPGSIARAHTTDEWISVDELVDAARAYARLLVDWCGLR